MLSLPRSLTRVIQELSKLPGIGPKTAQRLAFFLLKKEQMDLNQLGGSISDMKKDIVFCNRCHTMAETNPCSICSDGQRDQKIICVVEEPLDAIALDKTKQFRGVFHVLGGVLNPMEGIGPDQLTIAQLVERISNEGTTEIIIATNPTLEGETTALHLSKILKPLEVRLTRIARGLPMGGDLEYADEVTLSRALEGRREY